jgi:hypothetical protein
LEKAVILDCFEVTTQQPLDGGVQENGGTFFLEHHRHP